VKDWASLIAKYVTETAIRSMVEWSPSEIIPRLFVITPVVSFKLATIKEANIDESASFSFGDVSNGSFFPLEEGWR